MHTTSHTPQNTSDELARLTGRRPKTKSSPWPFVAAGGLLLGLVGWSQWSTPRTAVTLIAGIDASRSVRRALPGGSTLLGRSRSAVAELSTRLVPGVDRLKLVRVDRDSREFFDDTAISGNETVLRLLLDNTNPLPERDGTCPARFWTLAAQQAASPDLTPGAAVAVALASDADNDDLSAQAQLEIAQAARQLATNRRVVSVEILGASPKNWERLRQLFAPLGARFRLQPADAMNPRALAERLNAARTAAQAKGGER